MILLGAGLLLGLAACGADTPEAAMEDMIVNMETFADKMTAADNADQIVDAIDTFSQGMQDLVPRMKALQEKHPELMDSMGEGKLPKGMEKLEERFKAVTLKIGGATAKMMQFATDPKVQEAAKKFQEAMNALN